MHQKTSDNLWMHDRLKSPPALEAQPAAPSTPMQTKKLWHEAIGPALLALAMIALIARALVGGPKTLDPIIDFGRELYTPWQIAQGQHLYTDIAAFYGPLSQHLNALTFHLFSPTLTTLLITNIAILTLATTLLYAILRNISNTLAATVATFMFLAMFATAHVGAVGNFNFLTPYSHEATHGFTLTLAALFAFIQFTKTRRTIWAAAIGLALGCTILTKPEILLALVGGLTIGFTLLSLSKQKPWRAIATLFATALIPLALMTAYLATIHPFPLALQNTFAAFHLLANTTLTQSAFYANSTGMQNPTQQLTTILTTALRFTILLAPALLLSRLLSQNKKALGITLGTIATLIIAVPLGLRWWGTAGEILMLATLLLATLQIIATLRKGLTTQRTIQLTLTTVAILILAKMFLHTRFHQYGFVLAILPTVLLVIALIDWLPTHLANKNKNPWPLKSAALTTCAILTTVSLIISQENLNAQSHPITTPLLSFQTDSERAPILNDTIAWLQHNTTQSQTLTVLPEGITLNVLAQRPTSIPYLSAIPSDLAMFSEPAILAALQKSPPDFIAILDRPTDDFAQRNFGTDYATTLRTYIMQHYHPAHQSGPTPFTTQNFGILLLRRNAKQSP
jgi:hypothetical protein